MGICQSIHDNSMTHIISETLVSYDLLLQYEPLAGASLTHEKFSRYCLYYLHQIETYFSKRRWESLGEKNYLNHCPHPTCNFVPQIFNELISHLLKQPSYKKLLNLRNIILPKNELYGKRLIYGERESKLSLSYQCGKRDRDEDIKNYFYKYIILPLFKINNINYDVNLDHIDTTLNETQLKEYNLKIQNYLEQPTKKFFTRIKF